MVKKVRFYHEILWGMDKENLKGKIRKETFLSWNVFWGCIGSTDWVATFWITTIRNDLSVTQFFQNFVKFANLTKCLQAINNISNKFTTRDENLTIPHPIHLKSIIGHSPTTVFNPASLIQRLHLKCLLLLTASSYYSNFMSYDLVTTTYTARKNLILLTNQQLDTFSKSLKLFWFKKKNITNKKF